MSVATLQQIQDYARKAHGDQRRKYADEPYIQHPIRVMDLCRTVTDRLPMLAAALLHDVLEDTKVTYFQMEDFLAPLMSEPEARETLGLVKALTDEFTKEAYPQWNREVRKGREIARLATVSADAQTIKYADVIDNSRDVAASGSEFATKLLHEYSKLLDVIDKGDPVLRTRAINAVNKHLATVEK